MMRHIRVNCRRVLTATVASALAGLLWTSVSVADPLIIDGVTIADSATYEAAKQEGVVVVYGAYSSGSAKQLHDAFTDATGLTVEYVRAPSGQLFPKVTMEASAGQLRADIVDLTDLPLVDALVKQDILAPHKVPNFDSIDDVLKDPDGRWYTMVRLIYILGVNSAVIDPNTVKSWHDLTKPELKGSVGLPSIEAGGSAFSAYTFLRKQIGPEFLDALAANAPRIYPSVAPAMNDLARGEVSIGMITATTMQPQIALGAPVVPIYPEEGIPGFPISGGLTRAAIHPNAAKVYLNWITSLPGSNAVAATGGYGLSLGAARPVLGDLRLPEVDSLWNISLSDWVELRDKYIADWHKTFGAD